jgi:DNA-binding NarL/FixJ family response regulator
MPDHLKGPQPKKRVLVAEDQALVRSGLMQLINRQEDLTCCGEVDTPDAMSSAIARLSPDLVLLALCLGEADRLDLIKSLHAQFPRLPILVVSQHDETLHAERTLRSGARGYILKQHSKGELLGGIRAVLRGDLCVSREMAMRLVRQAVQPELPARRAGIGSLTVQELCVFRLLGEGLGTRSIAGHLGLSMKTIEAHRENIKHKLGLGNAAALVQVAAAWVRSCSPAPAQPSASRIQPGSSRAPRRRNELPADTSREGVDTPEPPRGKPRP